MKKIVYLIFFGIILIFSNSITSAGYGYCNLQGGIGCSPINQITTISGGGNGTSIHNDLTGLQGGSASEYYHLNNSIYTYLLSNIYSWSSNGSGGGNQSWNQSYADTLYAPINATFGGNGTQNLSDVLTIGNDAGGQGIINLLDPVNPQDAMTLLYAQTNFYYPVNFVDGVNYWSPASLTDDSQLGNGAGYLTAETDPLSLHLNGDNLMASNIDLSNTYNIINVIDPTNPQDVMTLNYATNNYANIIWGYNQTEPSMIYTDTSINDLNNSIYANFVPYLGAIQDLDLGINNLTTLGRISAGTTYQSVLGDDINLFAGRFIDGINSVTISNTSSAFYSTDGITKIILNNGLIAGQFSDVITTTILNNGSIAGQFFDGNYSVNLADSINAITTQGNASINGSVIIGDNQYIKTSDTLDGLTDSGSLTIKTGDTQNNNTGNIIIKSGENFGVAGSGRTGDINISTSQSTDGLAGNINIKAGYSTGNGATIGNGDNAGAINIIAGSNGNAGVSGMVNIVGGSGGGDPGTVIICGGSGGDTSGNVLLAWAKITNTPRGFVGIRNNNPQSELDVNGNVIINGTSAFTPVLQINGANTFGAMSINASARINTNTNFSAGGTNGITKTITIQNTTLTTCTLTIKYGIITGTTC